MMNNRSALCALAFASAISLHPGAVRADENPFAAMLDAMQQAAKPPKKAEVPLSFATVKLPQKGWAYSASDEELTLTHLATSAQVRVFGGDGFSGPTLKRSLEAAYDTKATKARNRRHKGRAFSLVGEQVVFGMTMPVYAHAVAAKVPQAPVWVVATANGKIPAEVKQAVDAIAASVTFGRFPKLKDIRFSLGGGFDGATVDGAVPGECRILESTSNTFMTFCESVLGDLRILLLPTDEPMSTVFASALEQLNATATSKRKALGGGKTVSFRAQQDAVTEGELFIRPVAEGLFLLIIDDHAPHHDSPLFGRRLRSVIKSLRIKKGTPGYRKIERFLVGHTLLRHSGTSDATSYSSSTLGFALCPGGISYNRSSSSFSTEFGGGARGASNERGRWKVVKRPHGFDLLVESNAHGLRTYSFKNVEPGGAIHISGKPWLMERFDCN